MFFTGNSLDTAVRGRVRDPQRTPRAKQLESTNASIKAQSESPEMLIGHRRTSCDPWAWFKEQGRETELAEEAQGLALEAPNFSLWLG